MLKVLMYFSFFFVLLGCIKEFNVTPPTLPQKVVVNSLFCPDSILKINISLSESIENEIQFVENAHIKLYKNDVFLQNVNYDQNGWYNSLYHPIENAKYKIEVTVPGHDPVWAESSIPKKSSISKYTCEFLEGYELEWGMKNSETIIEFQDEQNIENYYELAFFSDNNGISKQSFSLNPPYYNVNDISIKSDSDLDFKPQQYYFSDVLFSNEIKQIKLNYFGSGYYDDLINEFITFPVYLSLLNVSPEYYNFRKSWTKHVYNQNTDIHIDDPIILLFKGDPIEMYTNVNGGYGIFAGYNQQYKEVTYIP